MSNIPFKFPLLYAKSIAESNFDNLDQLLYKIIEIIREHTRKYMHITTEPPSVIPEKEKLIRIPSHTILIEYSTTFPPNRSGEFERPNIIRLNKLRFEKLFAKYKSSNQFEKDIATLLIFNTIVHEYAHYLQQYVFFGHKRVEADPEAFARYFTGIDIKSLWMLSNMLGIES